MYYEDFSHRILRHISEEYAAQNDVRGSCQTIEQLERSMVEMVRTLEARTNRRMQSMHVRLKALSNSQRDLNAQVNGKDIDLTMEQLEQSLESMERRIEDRIDKKIISVNERLKEIASTHASVTAGHSQSNRSATGLAGTERLEKRLTRVENRLESIATAVGVSVEANAGDDDADRKRLKEKLKEAIEVERLVSQVHYIEKESWLEYIFGICKPDGRLGKKGSRYVHN